MARTTGKEETMYKLIKLSSPSWEEERSTIEEVFSLLDLCVCDSCKINTFEDMKRSFESNTIIESFTDEDIQSELDSCCISEEYNSLAIIDKVNELMGTACGCEYDLEGSGVVYRGEKSCD